MDMLNSAVNAAVVAAVGLLLAMQMRGRFAALEAEMNRRFDQIDRHFDQIDRRFDQIDRHFDQIDRRFDQIDKRFDQIVVGAGPSAASGV